MIRKESAYSKLLKHPLWQRKRLEILNRDNFQCQICEDKETTLHIHHKEYIPGKNPWEYEDSNFITVCEDCHLLLSEEGMEDSRKIILKTDAWSTSDTEDESNSKICISIWPWDITIYEITKQRKTRTILYLPDETLIKFLQYMEDWQKDLALKKEENAKKI
jgi:hypothetical protein